MLKLFWNLLQYQKWKIFLWYEWRWCFYSSRFSAYWHFLGTLMNVILHETAFVVPGAKYQWASLPFGLMDAAFSLSYAMFNILEEFRSFARSFYDDWSYSVNEPNIIVMSKRFSINLQSLAFKLILRSVSLWKKRWTFLVMLLVKTGLNHKTLRN